MLFLLVYYLFISYWMNDLVEKPKDSFAYKKARVIYTFFIFWSKIRKPLIDFLFKKPENNKTIDVEKGKAKKSSEK